MEHLDVELQEPTDVVEAASPTQITLDAAWHREKVAFRAMFDELIKQYENKFVAIYQGRVVECGENMIDTSMAAYRKFGNVPMYVHLVSLQPQKPKRVFSPRIVRSRVSP